MMPTFSFPFVLFACVVIGVAVPALSTDGTGEQVRPGLPDRWTDHPGGVLFGFDANGSTEGWAGGEGLEIRSHTNGLFATLVAGADPGMSRERLHIQAALIDGFAVRMTASRPGKLTLFWGHDADDTFADPRSKTVPVPLSNDTFQTVHIDLRSAPEWKGRVVTRLRLSFGFPRDTSVALDWIGTSAEGDERPAKRAEGLTQVNGDAFLDNGTVRLGLGRRHGDAIDYLSASGGANLVNIADLGRLIQQSYYAGSSLDRGGEGQERSWSPWPWNPIQGGDARGHPADVLEISRMQHGRGLFSRTVPMLWDMTTGEQGKAWMDQWNELEPGMPDVIRVTCRFVCHRDPGDRWGQPRMLHQELPAVYLVRSLSRTMTYAEDAPWTGGPLVELATPAPPWGRPRPTEQWIAMVDPTNDVGVGLYSPIANQHWNVGAVGDPPAGPTSSSTMHMAPIREMNLAHDSIVVYRYWLIHGELTTIRKRVYELHARYPAG